MNITTRTLLPVVATVLLATACGGKTKKQETTPGDSSGGDATTGPASTSTETPTTSQGANLQEIVYFEFDKAELDADGKRKLEENASWIKEDPARILTIEGHTDEVGTPEYNLALGERRAKASRDYLLALGVDPTKVSVITYGEERPASQEDSQNRRSVFIATKK
jgi:peptidoglycan-associated lipoprotein